MMRVSHIRHIRPILAKGSLLSTGRDLCQPDVAGAFLHREHELIGADQHVQTGEFIRCKAAPGIMKMVDHKRIAPRPLGCGIQPPCPRATRQPRALCANLINGP